MPDEIMRLSEELARDPAGMAWVGLADALRHAHRLEEAERVAVRGLGRHPYHAEGHDVLARIAADGGDRTRARDEWEMTLRIEARHLGARLGLAWLSYSAGDRPAAARWWREAQELSPDDPRVVAMQRHLASDAETPAAVVPSSLPDASRAVFAELERAGARVALLVDEAGLVLAGRAAASHGPEGADALGAELSGLSADAERALGQLQLGGWEQLHVECERGTLALGPVEGGAVALVATGEGTPAGLTRLLLDRARRSGGAWMSAL